MAGVRRVTVTPDLIARLAEVGGLPLSPERQQALAPMLQEFLDGMARFEDVDLTGFEPPAAS